MLKILRFLHTSGQVCLETLPQKVSDGMPLSVVTSNIQGREVD